MISDEQWAAIEPLLPGQPGKPGRNGTNTRMASHVDPHVDLEVRKDDSAREIMETLAQNA